MRYFKKWWLVVCLVSTMVIGFTHCNNNYSKQFPLAYPVQKGKFKVTVSCEGEIVDKDEINVTAPNLWISLTLVDLVEDGTHVEKGDIVAKFDTSEVEKWYNDAVINLQTQQAALNKLKAYQDDRRSKLESSLKIALLDLELKQKEQESMEFEPLVEQERLKLEFLQKKLESERIKKEVQTQKKIDSEELKTQKLKIQKALTRLDRAREQLDMLTIKSPATGMVVMKRKWRGMGQFTKIEKGDRLRSGQAIMGITRLTNLQVSCQVNEIDIEKVQVGMPVNIELQPLPGKIFQGIVSDIAPLARESKFNTGIKIFQVKIALNNKNPLILPGYSANVEIVSKILQNVLYVPLEAVFTSSGKSITSKTMTTSQAQLKHKIPRTKPFQVNKSAPGKIHGEMPTKNSPGKNQEKEMIVYIVENNQPVKKHVTVGLKNDDFIIIKSGLRKSDLVLLRDPQVKLRKLGEKQPQPGTTPSGFPQNATR